MRSCVDVLDRYVTDLRSYMKRFPWPAGGDTSSTGSADPAQEEAQGDEWEQLQAEVTCPDRTLSSYCFIFVFRDGREKCPLMCHKSESVYVCMCVCALQEVVRQSILTNQIPRAQAVLRRRSCPEQHLPALRMEGLRQVFSCLQHRDLQTANTLLTNMVRTPRCRKQLAAAHVLTC